MTSAAGAPSYEARFSSLFTTPPREIDPRLADVWQPNLLEMKAGDRRFDGG